MRPTNGASVALALGSGGARGLAHIGVIEALVERGYRIDSISGSSMGALVGGIYALGALERYRDWVQGLRQRDVLGLLDWNFAGGGLIRGRKIVDELCELVGDADIEDLPCAYTAVAVDIDSGREVWLSEGSLFDAIRASIAIPGVFTPHRYRDRTLVDGGLLNPVPVAPTMRSFCDLTVAVDVNGPARHTRTTERQMQARMERDRDADEDVLQRLKSFVGSFSADRSPESGGPGLMAVLVRSLETMESVIARQQLAVFQPDLVVTVPRDACMVHEFHRAGEVIEVGRELTARALDAD